MAAFAIDIDEAAGQPFEEAKAIGAGKGVQGAGRIAGPVFSNRSTPTFEVCHHVQGKLFHNTSFLW